METLAATDRKRYPKDMEESINQEKLVNKAIEIWEKSQVVHKGPPGYGPEALQIQSDIVACGTECEQYLFDILDHKNHLVVGYALLTLEKIGSKLVSNLPHQLLRRGEKITILEGSFSISMDLGGLAKQILKRNKETNR